MELAYDDIRATVLTRNHLGDEVQGINASLELIRRMRGGSWPAESVTEDFNYVGLVWHECEFREGDSFAYAVYDAAGHYLGCCYLSPMGRRTRRDGLRQGRRARSTRTHANRSSRSAPPPEIGRDAGDARRMAHNPEVAGSNPAPATK